MTLQQGITCIIIIQWSPSIWAFGILQCMTLCLLFSFTSCPYSESLSVFTALHLQSALTNKFQFTHAFRRVSLCHSFDQLFPLPWCETVVILITTHSAWWLWKCIMFINISISHMHRQLTLQQALAFQDSWMIQSTLLSQEHFLLLHNWNVGCWDDV